MKSVKTPFGFKYIGEVVVKYNPRTKEARITGMHKPFKCTSRQAQTIADDINSIDFSKVKKSARESRGQVRKIRFNLYYNHGVNCCFVCDKFMDFKDATLEHIIPIDKGGATRYENYSLSHEECNISKGDTL